MKWWWKKVETLPDVPKQEPPAPPAGNYHDLMRMQNSAEALKRRERPIKKYVPPEGVVRGAFADPQDIVFDEALKAMDEAIAINGFYGTPQTYFMGLGFPGYPYLTELSQVAEYRNMAGRIADEMTRNWVELKSTSDRDRTEKIKALKHEMQKYGVREIFRQAAEMEALMGRCQIFIDVGQCEGDELATPLMINPYKITVGSLRKLKIVEPITTYPYNYNASNPLADDFYVPSTWFVYGMKVHSSRLLTFVSRPVPNLLKPVYNFGGMSLSQLAEPYVEYWIKTRNSVGRLLSNFSTAVLKTGLSDLLNAGKYQEILKRADFFNANRDNQGLFVIDNELEDFAYATVSLTGLDKLQAQAQEHMSAVSNIPLVVLLGVTPSGLNQTNDGEIRVFYDYIHGMQEKLFQKPLETVLQILQLNLWGKIDPDITFEFISLHTVNEKDRAEINKIKAETDISYLSANAITNEEIRKKIATDRGSDYNLDVQDMPPPLPDEQAQDTKEIFRNILAMDMKPSEPTKLTLFAARDSSIADKKNLRSRHRKAEQANERAKTAHLEALKGGKDEEEHKKCISAHEKAIIWHKERQKVLK